MLDMKSRNLSLTWVLQGDFHIATKVVPHQGNIGNLHLKNFWGSSEYLGERNHDQACFPTSQESPEPIFIINSSYLLQLQSFENKKSPKITKDVPFYGTYYIILHYFSLLILDFRLFSSIHFLLFIFWNICRSNAISW